MLELKSKKYVKENKADFEKAGIYVPSYDTDSLYKKTFEAPVWIHFGSGNLFKAFHCVLAQDMIEKAGFDKGIIVAETFGYDMINKVYKLYDNLVLQVVMKADGNIKPQIVSSVTEAIAADSSDKTAWDRMKEIFANPSLQMASFSITEKGYDLKTLDGSFKPEVIKEFESGISAPSHAMLKLTALMFERYKKGKYPIALVSTDNFSHNGDKLKAAVLAVANEWKKRGHTEQGFIDYLSEPKKTAFPWSMIDKITPYPAPKVQEQLKELGLGKAAELIPVGDNMFSAVFVNTEEAQYLVIEDSFPNGRPPLEKAGVYFTNRETVDKVEKMKVCTCLNPLHTVLAIFGCILGFKSISAEVRDEDLFKMVNKVGYDEGMPVVVDPAIIKPADFIKEVLTVRFPNPNIPDTPQRIATDTSQKLGIRFGETIKLYGEKGLDINKLVFIPLAIAGWCRYLLALDDEGKPFTPSPDPLLKEAQALLKGIEFGKPQTADGKLKEILSNTKIFGSDLYKAGLGERIEMYFKEMIAGAGAVRKTIKKYLA
ncbi:MAG: mannitol dehydrogenase family protein [Elusimicrobiota bacterium]|jgi:fructuronate reductase|nr:mannitol dehydrogenase family protein [Elusimicrobiota bacterium]